MIPFRQRKPLVPINSSAGVRAMSGPGLNNLIDRSPSFSDSADDSDEAAQQSWIEWWTRLKGNEFLCEVSEEFLRDEFNLYGFSAQVQRASLQPCRPKICVEKCFVSALCAIDCRSLSSTRFLSILTPSTSSSMTTLTSTTKSWILSSRFI